MKAMVAKTTLGEFALLSDGRAIVATALPGADFDAFRKKWGAKPGTDAILEWAARELRGWANGELQQWTVPVSPRGTPFQESVWTALQGIPYGSTQTYQTVAQRIGKPRAARAVGNANNRNPVAPFVPCHRVVAAAGLGGYGGGLTLKQAMLRIEGALDFGMGS